MTDPINLTSFDGLREHDLRRIDLKKSPDLSKMIRFVMGKTIYFFDKSHTTKINNFKLKHNLP